MSVNMSGGDMFVDLISARNARTICRSIFLNASSVGYKLVIGVGGIGCEYCFEDVYLSSLLAVAMM